MPVRSGKKRSEKKLFFIEESDRPHVATRPGSFQVPVVAASKPAGEQAAGVAPFSYAEIAVRDSHPSKSLAGWHRDPTHRHEFRFYDGDCWTANVMNARAASIDPIASVSDALKAPRIEPTDA